MEMQELKNIINRLNNKVISFEETINIEDLKQKITSLDNKTYENDFWNDQKSAQAVILKLKDHKNIFAMYEEIISTIDELKIIEELAIDDISLLLDADKLVSNVEKKIIDFEVKILLSKPYDKLNAILELHPGAGGTESQDWCEMLYRMYTRWAESKNFKIEVLDYLPGDEAGIKSVTILISGVNVYGYLKAEVGVHRLVRISPFDSSGRRHTSFASVNVVPEIDDRINVEINECDLKIDTYRSSGAGGQSVNTTDSAVRITHLPTKTVVTCQNERSQIKNRDKAIQVLKGKLYKLEIERQKDELENIRGEKLSNSWGSQIRSYIFHPYTLVKDHRTNVEIGNWQKVMNGEIDEFINSYLRMFK